MFGVTLSADEINAAPSHVRRWLEQQVASTLNPTAPQRGSFSDAPARRPSIAAQGEVEMLPTDKTTNDEEIRNLIAVRAYELWENQGRPSGHELINWHAAEEEIMSSIGNRHPSANPAAKGVKSAAPLRSQAKRVPPLTTSAGEI